MVVNGVIQEKGSEVHKVYLKIVYDILFIH